MRARYLAVAAPALLLFAFLATLTPSTSDYSLLADGVLGNLVLIVPALICLGRGLLVRAQRPVFLLVGLAAAAFTAGNIAYLTHVQYQDPVPYPSLADVGYLTPYPLLLVAVVLLAWPELRGLSRGAFLDGLLSALGCATVGAVLTVRPLIAGLDGGLLAKVVGAAYPVSDLTLAALIIAVLTLKGGRPGWSWVWLGSGVVTFAVADTTYLYRVVENTYTVGTPLDGLWAIGLNLMAVAAVVPYRPGARRAAESPSMLVLTTVFSFAAVAILVYGSLSDHNLPIYVVVLTSLTLLAAVQRIAVGFSALRQLAQIQQQARTDELTQLSNRRHFDERAQQLLTGRPAKERLALVMVDLNDFKAVNDTLGHQAGDEMLRQVSARLRNGVRSEDVVARLGGDEFGILLAGADRDTAVRVAESLSGAVAEPYLLDGVLQNSSASIGISLCPDDGVDLAILLQRADLAMFDAKAGSQRVVVYDSERLGSGIEQLNVRDALTRRELFVEYQPQFDAAEQLSGVEALVRWQHPVRGLITPDRFLPLFERAGLMAELTMYVLNDGARERRRWRLDGLDLQLSVNMAPSALLDDGLIGSVSTVLARHGMPSSALTLEITESVPVAESERSLRTLNQLRELGIHLSLDDYGTGWCSLSYLRDLPLDEVKIDRSFVLDLVPGSADATIVGSTVQLARALNLRTVAEGVENVTALETLRALGCEHFQGYLLGRPGPPEAIPRHRDRGLILPPNAPRNASPKTPEHALENATQSVSRSAPQVGTTR